MYSTQYINKEIIQKKNVCIIISINVQYSRILAYNLIITCEYNFDIYYALDLSVSYLSAVAFAGAIAVWAERDRLHISETPDRVILYLHVS